MSQRSTARLTTALFSTRRLSVCNFILVRVNLLSAAGTEMLLLLRTVLLLLLLRDAQTAPCITLRRRLILQCDMQLVRRCRLQTVSATDSTSSTADFDYIQH